MSSARTRTGFLTILLLLVGGGLVVRSRLIASARSAAAPEPHGSRAANRVERAELESPRAGLPNSRLDEPTSAAASPRRAVQPFEDEFFAEIHVLVRTAAAGDPVAGSVVRVSSWPFFAEGSSVRLTDRTDAAGRASLRVPLGRVEVTALDDSKPVSRFASAGANLVEPGTTELELELEVGRTLRGVVVDAQLGTPIPEAVVSNDFLDSLLGTPTVTDAEGRFALSPWPTGMEAGVTVTAVGYGQDAVRIRVEPDDSWTCPARFGVPAREGTDSPFVEVQLVPQRVVAGVLIDEGSNRPIEGGWARAEGVLLVSDRFGRADEAATITDSTGAFVLDGLRPEVTHTVWVGAEGFASRRVLVESGDLLVDLGRIALRQSASLSGRVLDTRGEPVGGVSIRVRTIGSSGLPVDSDPREGTNDRRDGFSRPRPLTLEARTDADGFFEVGGLPGGHVRVEARVARMSLTHREVALAAGLRTSLEDPLVLDGDRRSVSGKVIDLSDRSDSILLELSDPRLGPISETVMGASGHFRIWGLKPGRTYALQASLQATVLWQGSVTLDDEPLQIEL